MVTATRDINNPTACMGKACNSVTALAAAALKLSKCGRVGGGVLAVPDPSHWFGPAGLHFSD
ncbi:MAG: hypothetical protein LH491_07380 [Pseudoxanthomonas sp.]|nr:hypothetical protein [Pseudoxanthomonas sp.]